MRPSVIVFDVNETLSDLSPLAARFVDVGAPGSGAALWFASVLRDGFALTAAGGSRSFADIAAAVLRQQFAVQPPNRPVDEAVAHVLAGFAELVPHPDVPPGVRALGEQGCRLVTLSNGAAAVADRLLSRAGLRDEFEMLLSVEDAGMWKPHPRAYAYAASACAVDLADMLMVASHPWDLEGAARAGLRTAWVNRTGAAYPSVFAAPDHTVEGVDGLAELLG